MPQFDEDSYVALLAKLINENRFVQNNPPDLIPQVVLPLLHPTAIRRHPRVQEGRIAKHVLEALTPYSKATGGPLDIQVHEFAEGRPNIVVRRPFVGAVYGRLAGHGTCEQVRYTLRWRSGARALIRWLPHGRRSGEPGWVGVRPI